jgi:hypothetical protein
VNIRYIYLLIFEEGRLVCWKMERYNKREKIGELEIVCWKMERYNKREKIGE